PALSGSRDLALAMLQGGGDRPLVHARAVVALDQHRNGAALLEPLRPGERLVEIGEFLEQPAVLLQRGDRFGTWRSGEDFVRHRGPRVMVSRRLRCGTRSTVRFNCAQATG